jgi:hypothetical protein
MTPLIEQYQSSLTAVHTLEDEATQLKDQSEKVTNKLTWDYRDKIHSLERELITKTEALKSGYEARNQTYQLKISVQRDTLRQIERILSFLAIKPVPVVWEDSAIEAPKKSWHGQGESPTYFMKPLDMIYDDPYLKIKGFIIENHRKPVNKYCLCLFGRCLFKGRDEDDKILNYPHVWGAPGNQIHQQINTVVKDFPTVQSGIDYFNRNRSRLLKDFIHDFIEAKAEYEKIIHTYTLADFRPLFTYECKACGFFLTPMTEGRYARGETCHHCGIHTTEANKIAACSKKNLPVFVSEVWKSKAGEEFYQRRLHEATGFGLDNPSLKR